MPRAKTNNQAVRQRAVVKYRRQRTIIKKMLELAKMRSLKMNLIIYDPKSHKAQEIYTDE